VTYDIYLWKDGDIKPLIPTAMNLSDPGFDPPVALEYSAIYHWQVVARNAFGQTPGPVWLFHTGNGSPAPGKNAVKPQEWMLHE
jgi:hypothetical protein